MSNSFASLLRQKITRKNGKPDFLAIDIYTNALSNMRCFEYQTNYAFLSSFFKCSSETIRKRIVRLEQLGLLEREFRDIKLESYIVNNVLFLIVKDNELVKEFNKNKDYSI